MFLAMNIYPFVSCHGTGRWFGSVLVRLRGAFAGAALPVALAIGALATPFADDAAAIAFLGLVGGMVGWLRAPEVDAASATLKETWQSMRLGWLVGTTLLDAALMVAGLVAIVTDPSRGISLLPPGFLILLLSYPIGFIVAVAVGLPFAAVGVATFRRLTGLRAW